MADALTANLKLKLPEIGSSKDTWGTKLNDNFTALDRILGPTAPNGLFMPRAGGDFTGAVKVASNDAYIVNLGVASHPATITRKSDGDVVYLFDGARAAAGTVAAPETVLNARMADARYLRPSAPVSLTGGNLADVFLGHQTRALAVRRVADDVDTHTIWDDDITTPDTPSQPNSLITRAMGDKRYARKDVDNALAVKQTINAALFVTGAASAEVRMESGAGHPLAVVRKGDGVVTHLVHNSDISSPDTPTHIRSILTTKMGDGRYARLSDSNTFNSAQKLSSGATFEGFSSGIVSVGLSDNPFRVVRAAGAIVTHAIWPDDVTGAAPSQPTSLINRAFGDARYARMAAVNEDYIMFKRATFGAVSLLVPGVAVQTGGADQASLTYHFRALNAASSAVMQISQNGNIQNVNNAYGAISDRRLKEHIVDASPQLDDVLALQVRNFNMKRGDKEKQIGLIAQEVQQIKPGLVEEDADGYLSVKYSILVPILLKAVQELAAQVKALSNSPVAPAASKGAD